MKNKSLAGLMVKRNGPNIFIKVRVFSEIRYYINDINKKKITEILFCGTRQKLKLLSARRLNKHTL